MMAPALDALDVDLGPGLMSNPGFMFGPAAAMNGMQQGEEYVSCRRCGFGGCDLRLSGCGCTMHA